MDDAGFKAVSKRLAAVNKVISELDPAVRASAFEILKPYVDAEEPDDLGGGVAKKKSPKPGKPVNTEEVEQFFSKHEHTKEADNVLLIAGWLYGQYGVFDMTVEKIRELADANGLSIPNRVDMTLRQFKKKGKTLFRKTAAGWRLTTPGERHMKETYAVRKGTKPLPEADE